MITNQSFTETLEKQGALSTVSGQQSILFPSMSLNNYFLLTPYGNRMLQTGKSWFWKLWAQADRVYSSISVWEVMFHKSNPDHLFTCSQDGSVWQWNGSSMNSPAMDVSHILNPNPQPREDDNTRNAATPWLSADVSKHKIETFSLLPYNRLPVNSLDVSSRNLVCGTDGDAVYIVKNLDIG